MELRHPGDTEYLVGLWEDTVGQDNKKGRGRVYLFPRTNDGGWAEPRLSSPSSLTDETDPHDLLEGRSRAAAD